MCVWNIYSPLSPSLSLSHTQTHLQLCARKKHLCSTWDREKKTEGKSEIQKRQLTKDEEGGGRVKETETAIERERRREREGEKERGRERVSE